MLMIYWSFSSVCHFLLCWIDSKESLHESILVEYICHTDHGCTEIIKP